MKAMKTSLGGLVTCALASALVWAVPVPVQAQTQVVCGPAETIRAFLEGHNLKRSAMGELADGDHLEAWERPDRIVLVILTPAAEPTRCIVGEVSVKRGQGA